MSLKKKTILILLLFLPFLLVFYFLPKKNDITIENDIGISSEIGTETAGEQIDIDQNKLNEEQWGESNDMNDEAVEVIPEKKGNEETDILSSKEDNGKPVGNKKLEAVADDLVNWGFSPGRSSAVDTVVIHSVCNKLGGNKYDPEKIIGIFKDYGVAPHYIIERSGNIRRLVLERNTAYHAGESRMPDGRTGVNDFSIGIEVINAEDDKPEKSQYESLGRLLGAIKNRYKIKYILGHSDIAPERKTDPWNFDWGKIGGKMGY
jgi:hypothetical protein